ncbi:MAG: hypothetical protein FJW30_28730 [Acidobacteria bacterium]|nr:hypothetical protein [Acidobacteriota bacterium]
MRVHYLPIIRAASLAAQGFRAGTARRDVTPTEPVPMWGYADRHAELSSGVDDPLYADALVIDAGGSKLAIVGLDLGRAPADPSLDRILARIRREAGIEHALIGGSHTHNGPVLELKDEEGKGKGKFDAALRYYRRLEDSIVAAVIEANGKLEPARAAAGSARLEKFNRNRQSKLEPKPSDRELSLLRVDTMDGRPLAILVNWAAHPTTIPSSRTRFSADYVGALKLELTKATGAATVFIQGAAGDQATNRAGLKTTEYGAALAAEAVKLAQSLAPTPIEKPALQWRQERFRFAPRVDLKNPAVAAGFEQAFFPELIRNYRDENADSVRPVLSVALLNGEIAMVGVSGEFFSQHAVRLKERARVKHLFFFGYCNGYHHYFPTIEAAAEGGYGASGPETAAAVGAGEQMMDKALLWLYEMRGQIRPLAHTAAGK